MGFPQEPREIGLQGPHHEVNTLGRISPKPQRTAGQVAQVHGLGGGEVSCNQLRGVAASLADQPEPKS